MRYPKCTDCDEDADPLFEMDFSDVEPGAKIHWCTAHGPEAHAMNELMVKAFKERGPGFADELEAAIENAERNIQ